MTEDVLGRTLGVKGCLFFAPISHRYLLRRQREGSHGPSDDPEVIIQTRGPKNRGVMHRDQLRQPVKVGQGSRRSSRMHA